MPWLVSFSSNHRNVKQAQGSRAPSQIGSTWSQHHRNQAYLGLSTSTPLSAILRFPPIYYTYVKYLCSSWVLFLFFFFNFQVQRLDSAILEECKQLSDSNVIDKDSSVNQKRKRDSISEKIKAVDVLKYISLKKLRADAALRGIETTGSKKRLLERLFHDDCSVEACDDIPQGAYLSNTLVYAICFSSFFSI